MVEKKVELIRKQVLTMWKKTVNQIEEFSRSLMKTSGLKKQSLDRAVKLLSEREKLLNRLGEETYKLIDQHKVKVPKTVQNLYIRIRGVMDRIIISKSGKKRAARKASPRKKTAR